MKTVYNMVYKAGVLRGYSCKYGFIEKHYSNICNLRSPQQIEYRVAYLEKIGKNYIFARLNDAKVALEGEFENETI